MKKHLKFIDGNSDKFWQIETSGLKFTVTYGKNGTSGVSQTKTFASDEECLKAAEKLLAEKTKKGYSENGEVIVTEKIDSKTGKVSNIGAILNEYDCILAEKDATLLLAFLKEKSKGNLETLKKHIKKCKRYWMTYTDLSKEPEFKAKTSYNWGTRGDNQHSEIITLSAIAIFDKTDILTWDEPIGLLNRASEKHILEILLWAKPNWIEIYLLDRFKKNEWSNLDYESLRFLEDQSLLNFNPELTALCIARYNEYNKKLKTRAFISYLINDKIAYQRDIPEVFNYETNIHNLSFRDDEKQNYNEFSMWGVLYKSLLNENKMEKSFFIENAILIQTKDWNNNLKSFFRKQIDDLNLDPEAFIPFQENIFTFLHNAYPPITSYGIELVKKMYEHPKFKTKSFLEWLEPMMMRNDCKAGIKSVLPILEKISKLNSKFNKTITALIADVYIIADLGLQERASKILLKIASKKDTVLSEKLSSYTSLMQGSIKSSLNEFLSADDLVINHSDIENYSFNPQKVSLLTEAVELPSNWNDILFQFGKFISSDEVLDTEILMNVYITQQHLFPQDYTKQLQPYFKQLEKTYFEGIHKAFTKAFLMNKILNMQSVVKIKDNTYNKINTLKLINPLLEKVQGKINNKSTLPLLSFPSHKPHWVAPKVLLQRIIDYQNAKENIDILDLSIAISRMPRENVEEAIPLLNNIDGEIKSVLAFCLGESTVINLNSGSIFSKLLINLGGATKNTEYIALWAIAARTFYPNETFTEFEKTYLNDIPFVVSPFVPKIEFKEKWNEWTNYQTKVKERSASWYELGFDFPTYKNTPNYLLYSLDSYDRGKSWEYTVNSAENVYYWHSLMPQNTDPMALTLLKTSCAIPEGAQNDLKGFLNIVNLPGFQFSETTTLLFACCFFQEKKELRLLASEVLINIIEKQAIDIEVFAQKIAFLASSKYGVFLRLVDSIVALKDVSPIHNDALYKLMDTIFKNLELQDKLPTNFKKMIENYVDILSKTIQKPSVESVIFFKKYKDNASLKSLIKQILN
jgi:predicted DNA-binding WGR domain protein